MASPERDSRRVAALLRFLRVSAAPTAPADVLAGFALAASSDRGLAGAAVAAVASAALYLAGMGLNDLCDRRHDAVHRPSRPIPTGAVSIATAIAVVLSCFGIGLALGLFAGRGVGTCAFVLAGLIAAYDVGGKRIPVLGPTLMGACRAVNLFMGGAAAPGSLVLFPLLHGAYTLSLTLGSSHEEGSGVPGRFVAFALPAAAVPLVSLALLPERIIAAWPASLLSIMLAALAIRAWRQGTARAVRQWVQIGVLGFLLYDAALIAGTGRPFEAALVAALFPVCLLWARRFAAT